MFHNYCKLNILKNNKKILVYLVKTNQKMFIHLHLSRRNEITFIKFIHFFKEEKIMHMKYNYLCIYNIYFKIKI